MTPLRLVALGLAVGLAALSIPTRSDGSPGGAPSGVAGDRVEGDLVLTCALCHGSFDLNSGSGGVSIDAPASVAPGETVPITVTVDNTTPEATPGSRRQGFEVTVREGTDRPAVGTLAPDNVTTRWTLGTEDYVTHTSGGTARTSWTVDWTAPAAGAPDSVVVFAAANAADGDASTDGDHVYTATRSIQIRVGSASEPAVRLRTLVSNPAPNPARSRTTVEVTLAAPSRVVLRVVDGRGRTLRQALDAPLAAGRHAVPVDVSGLAPGVYFVVVEAGGERQARPVSVVG